jgi:ABC-type branched-subunit amino acid transport system ATPase component/branched-subunit amino acid ABC-type transport system permease component
MPAILVYALLSIPLIGAYAIFAFGISVIYRASRVLNLAHGAMAMVPAYITFELHRRHVPLLVAVVVGVSMGAGLGIAVERFFVRRLRPQGPTAQTVGTVAVTGLLIAFAAKVWGTNPQIAPNVFPVGVVHIGNSGIKYGQIGLFLTGIIVSTALFIFFKTTQVGLAMRGAAQNRRAASLMGIDPDLAASGAWALGGGLAALGGIMLAGVTNLDPYNLSLQVLPAFVAALIGGLESLPGALAGASIAGLAFGIVPYFSGTPVIGTVARFSGSPQLALTILALVVMGTRGRRLSGAQVSEAGLSTGGRPFKPMSSGRFGWMLILSVPVIVLFPFLVPYSVLGDAVQAVQLGLVAVSLVVLTGWVGQISLAHASFVGIAALTTGLVVRSFGLSFPANMIVAAAVAAGAAVGLGVVALRVRGLYLAVATMIFAWMCDSFLFRTPWMGASSGSSTISDQQLGKAGGFPAFDFTSRHTFFYVSAAILVILIFILSNLRDTKTGRAFFAVRGSEMAAASLGIDVVRYKLLAFALSGAIAGVAGNMLMVEQRTVVPAQFLFTASLQFLAIAVVGGLGSLGGAIGAGMLFAGLTEVFYRVRALTGWLDAVSAALLAIVLLAYPGGLAAVFGAVRDLAERVAGVGRSVSASKAALVMASLKTPSRKVGVTIWEKTASSRDRVRALASKARPRTRSAASAPRAEDWFTSSVLADPIEQVEPIVEAEPSSNGHGPDRSAGFDLGSIAAPPPLHPDRHGRAMILDVEGITVQFGGLRAVSDASLAVREGEIVGLIGPNGAGKTTLFNAILGLNDPAAGRIQMYGQDVTSLAPHQRARLGVARTFQVLQLFSELSVFDNLLVATHLHNEAGAGSNLIASSSTLAAERAARKRVTTVLRLLDLEEHASSSVRGLPFGVLRMIELARALVTGARLIMLDEPASGLNEAETDKLATVVRGARALGVSVLLIEHDVRMVTGISDYIYVLNQGQILTHGEPAEVQRHPEVIAAYLGEPVHEEVLS